MTASSTGYATSLVLSPTLSVSLIRKHVNPRSPSLNIEVFGCWGSGVFRSSACSNTLYVKLLILVSSPKPSANQNRGAITGASMVLIAWVSLEAHASSVWSSSWRSPSSIHFHMRFGMPQLDCPRAGLGTHGQGPGQRLEGPAPNRRAKGQLVLKGRTGSSPDLPIY